MRSCLLLILATLPVLTEPGGPRVLDRTAPEYTDEARMARLEGSVLVTAVVDVDSTLRDIHVTRPIGLGLDERALAAVKEWKFAPAVQGDHPVEAVARVEVNFRMLIPRGEWHLARIDFAAPPGATRPIIVSAPFPERPASAEPASATVSFDVTEQGMPSSVHVEKSSDEKAAQEAEQLIGAWRFHPAEKNGQPVAAHCTLELLTGSALLSE